MHRSMVFTAGWLALLACGTAAAAPAQTWPSRPIRMIVPFPAGGNVDVFGRVMYRHVEQDLGQQIVIDNRGGANSILGSDIVAKANPDGYTFLTTSFGFAVNPAITNKLPFDVEKDFVPVTNIALGTGYLMVINNSVPAKSVKDLIAYGKQKPLRYSTAGIGNGQHLAGALFGEKAGIEMLHVPYKGGGPAMTAVLGGEVEVHYPAAAVGLPHVKAGKVRAIGFTGAKRLSSLPDVPTIAEAGLTGYVSDAGWHAVFAPAKTPAAIVNRMHAAIRKALDVPQVRDHFLNGGYEPQGAPPAEWAKLFRADLKRYAEIVRIAKIQKE
ncbi:MAG TPA: tripartite tricarboxylate transporter substrate binding protein [Burkholderiales bacterium]|nr:tripartite tricarboxylate transporter substrate binding protein [Burkholderiales bacterium]